MTLRELVERAHAASRAKGWYDAPNYLGIDLEESVIRKMTYNATRPYRHGNKRA